MGSNPSQFIILLLKKNSESKTKCDPQSPPKQYYLPNKDKEEFKTPRTAAALVQEHKIEKKLTKDSEVEI